MIDEPKIKLQTLVITIQVLEREIRELKALCESNQGKPEDALFLTDLMMAAENLEQVYRDQSKDISNFPSYEDLVKLKS